MRAWSALLFVLAGCSGPPLKELPVLEPPPPAPPLRVEKAVPSAPPLVPAPTPPPETRVEGAWRSQEMAGPGSAAFQWIDFIFGEDGSYVGVARGSKSTAVISGSFEVRGGDLVLQGKDGRRRVWSFSFEERRLTLKDGEASLVLDRIR